MLYNPETNSICDGPQHVSSNAYYDDSVLQCCYPCYPMNSAACTNTVLNGPLQNCQRNQGNCDDIFQSQCHFGSKSGAFQMSYGDGGDAFAPGPSNIILDMEKQSDTGLLGPLEIDVSEMGGISFGCAPKGLQPESAESSSHHRTPLSDGTERCYNSGAASSAGPATSPGSSSGCGGSSCNIYPHQVRRKSKGKPENVCQLMALMEQKTSIASTTAQYEKKSERTLPKGRSISVATVGDLRDPSCSGGGGGGSGASFSSTVATAPMSLKQFASQLRSPRFFEPAANVKQSAPYTPPPMLSPMRRGSGLFWKISQTLIPEINIPKSSQENNYSKARASSNRCESETDEEPLEKRSRRCMLTTGSMEDGSAEEEQQLRTPTRKNGLCYSSQVFDAKLLRLEALRKESDSSWNSSSARSSSIPPGAADLSSPKRLPAPVDGEALRKVSSCSDFDEEVCVPPESDAVPHINCGRDYQAKVKKWADRAITDDEREAIPDRDDAVFDCNIIDHLDDSAVEAYELLACSRAVPRQGRNRELALHLLMENKGNIQEAVLDLMRMDTLDWSQYPIVYNSIYTDTNYWTPEEINFFQDAIYKSEKDFHQVARDLGNKTVKQCVEFYYMWKKACPDDYRKLRNLRRKRQLLEMQQQLDLAESYNLRSNNRPVESGEVSGSEGGSDISEIPYDTDKMKKAGQSELNPACSPLGRKCTTVRFAEPPHTSTLSALIASGIEDTPPRSLPQIHRSPLKKGAQPAADGFFHCRLCDKYFEKVKSLNAHMKSHAMKARAEAEAAQTQLKLQQQQQQQQRCGGGTNAAGTASTSTTPQRGSPVAIDLVPQLTHHQQQTSLNHDPLGPGSVAAAQVASNNLAAAAAVAAVAAEQNPFGPVLGKAAAAAAAAGGLGQDLFVQTSLTPEQQQFAQNTLMNSPLGHVSLAAHQALNQSLTAASVLSQFPQAQALQFLSNLQNPAITH